VAKLNLVGWSWGTAIMGTYTAQNDVKVNRLVLYAPLHAMREAPPISGVGAYRSVQRAPARHPRHPGRPRRGDQPTRLVRPVVRRQPRHPAAIRVPTLSIIAEWDQDTPFTWRRRSSRR
jgi:pimeloyl-ACP methyl ester carboxylesterase